MTQWHMLMEAQRQIASLVQVLALVTEVAEAHIEAGSMGYVERDLRHESSVRQARALLKQHNHDAPEADNERA